MKRHVFILLLSFAGVLTSAFAASRQVQGVVISSEDNMPLIGASVYIKAEDLSKDGNSPTITGVITDIDGKFSIDAPKKSTLVISYIGYITKEIEVGDNNKIDIVLKEDAQSLDEVVVVGFGTQKKVNLTGAVATASCFAACSFLAGCSFISLGASVFCTVVPFPKCFLTMSIALSSMLLE